MFEKLRKRRRDRIAVRRQAMFDEAAAQSDPSSGPRDDRRARDLPDALGDLNETVRLGSTIGGSGGP